MPAVSRRGLCSNVKATFKRACFAQVTHPPVPEDVRVEHSKQRRAGVAFDR